MKINVQIEVPEGFEKSLDMVYQIRAEIDADRWSWNHATTQPEDVLGFIREARGIVVQDLKVNSRELAILRTHLDEAEMWLERHMSMTQETKNDAAGS